MSEDQAEALACVVGIGRAVLAALTFWAVVIMLLVAKGFAG